MNDFWKRLFIKPVCSVISLYAVKVARTTVQLLYFSYRLAQMHL